MRRICGLPAGAALLVLAQACAPTARQFSPDAARVRVMTFNVRYNNPRDGVHAWPNRKTLVAGLIRYHAADILGLQEVLQDQMADLRTLLPDFEAYGVGRRDGKAAGEFAPVFYRRSRFRRLAQGTFWLSETPGVPGSRGWDAALERICTWIELADALTGKTFFVFNTHFDHRGQRAREQSAELLRRKMAEIGGQAPSVLLGDFNCGENSRPYAILTGAADSSRHRPRLHNAKRISDDPPYGPAGTFTGFTDILKADRTIDFIFVTAGIRVRRHAVLSDHLDGRPPSDHRPVVADILF